MSNFSDYTQLTSVETFDKNNMVFAKPQENNITIGDGKKIKFYRIPVGYRNSDKSVGEFVLETDKLFSYGIQENKNDRSMVDGYSMALCMWSRDGATPEQERWLQVFNEAIDHCKEHILSVKDKVEKYDLDEAELKRFNPLYWKRDKGQIVPGKGPTLYPKLIVSKKEQPPKIMTPFVDDATGLDLEATDLINKFCFAKAAVRIESIFVGAKVSPQVKLHEAMVRLTSTRSRRLLRPTVDPQVRSVSSANISAALGADDGSGDDGSIVDSSEEEEEDTVEETKAAPEPVKKKVVRRVIKRKAKPKA